MRTVDQKMFYADGTNSASTTIKPGSGMIFCTRLGYTSPDTGTLKLYRTRDRARANAAVAADTTLVIDTDAAGKVNGSVLTTNDYVLVENTTAGGTLYTLSAISNVAAVSSSTVSLTLATAVTCLEDDVVHIIRAADIVTMVTAAETVKDLHDAFVGYHERLVHVVLAATGTCRVHGVVDIRQRG